MKLSWVESRKYTGWTKWIGRTASTNKPRCFYLGKDRTDAEFKAIKLTLAYKQMIARGGTGWTDEAIEQALASTPAPTPILLPAPATTPIVIPSEQPIQNGLMLHDALDLYLKREEERAPGETSHAYVHGQRSRVRRLKRMLPNKLLAEVGYDDLARFVSRVASRPKSKLTKKKIGVVTATDTIKAGRAAFDWLDISGRWLAPRRFERIFRVNRKALLTPEERIEQNEGVQTFTVDELVKIVSMAWTRWHRMMIFVALNFAMTRNEVSCLSRRHLKAFDTDDPYIEKCREKTSIFCKWLYVFPEVVEGLKWLMASHDDDLLFISADGLPPVRFYASGRCDTVANWWRGLTKRAGVRHLTFRYLRKTAADMVRKLSDRDTSEAMLSHSNGGVTKVYTNHDWEKLGVALKALHEQLRPVLQVADVRPVIPRQRRSPKLTGSSSVPAASVA